LQSDAALLVSLPPQALRVMASRPAALPAESARIRVRGFLDMVVPLL
jgi:hypothetical protein